MESVSFPVQRTAGILMLLPHPGPEPRCGDLQEIKYLASRVPPQTREIQQDWEKCCLRQLCCNDLDEG